jgi:phosphohistidine phosphatase
MALYLVQHAAALSKREDPQRGLNASGIAEAERISAVAAGYSVEVGRIVHSGKKRARQTAEIFATALAPTRGLAVSEGLAPLDDVVSFAKGIANADNLMLVGHLPFMARLASHLVVGNADVPVFLFQNGGIVCLTELADHDSWAIKWALMPHVGAEH